MSHTDLLGRSVSVRLPDDLRHRVEKLAVLTRRSRGAIIREAMEREVARLEWEYEILDRARAIRQGRESTVSLAELNEEFGDHDEVDLSILDEIS